MARREKNRQTRSNQQPNGPLVNGRRRAAIAGAAETRHHMGQGINLIADLLAPTLGPISGHIVNERTGRSNRAELLDDSATAVRRILSLGDPRIDVGAMLMRNLIWHMSEEIGDGGATVAVLTRAIYRDAARLMASGINYRNLERGMETATKEAVSILKAQTHPVHSEDELAAVAFAVTRDRPLSAIAGEMAYLLGPDARITVQKYVAPYLEREYHAGTNYEAQIASYLLYTDQTRKRAVMSEAAVALVDGSLTSAEQAVALLEAAMASGKKSLLIVANHFKEAALHVIVSNQQAEKKKINLLGASLKVVGDERRQAFDDLGLLTGATVLERGFTKPAQQARPQDLGGATRVEVGTKSLRLLPERKQAAAVRQAIEEVRARLENMPHHAEERPKLMLRLSAMSGGMGLLKVGASSKLEREMRADNAERALKVMSGAQKTGVVPGGGAAFYHVAHSLDLSDLPAEERLGAEVIQRALASPLRQILDNARVEAPGVILERLKEAGPASTYDALCNRVVDAREAGILDVSGVQVAALQTAASGAMMALSTDTIVYHRKPEQSMEP